MLARIAGTIAFAGLFAFWLFTGPQASAQQKTEAGNAQLVVYHKCLNLTLMTGMKWPAVDHYMYLAGKSIGATPLCSVRSFRVPVGEHSLAVREWTGMGLSLIERTARFAPGQTVHVLVDKGYGGKAHWSQITAQQARALAQEINTAYKK